MDKIHAMVLNTLEAANGLAKNNPLARILVGEFKNFLAGAHLIGAKNRQRFFQSVLDNPPARAGADDVAGRNLHLVEFNFGYGNREPGVNTGHRNTETVPVRQNQRDLAVLCARGADITCRCEGIEDKFFAAFENKIIA